MKQKLSESHVLDSNGNPAGGGTLGAGITIVWQNGPLGRQASGTCICEDETFDGQGRIPNASCPKHGVGAHEEPNGAFVEGVIQAAIGRLRFFQTGANGKFACRENAIALTKLEEALMWLEKRTADREAHRP